MFRNEPTLGSVDGKFGMADIFLAYHATALRFARPIKCHSGFLGHLPEACRARPFSYSVLEEVA
jgi:hypothetical protein